MAVRVSGRRVWARRVVLAVGVACTVLAGVSVVAPSAPAATGLVFVGIPDEGVVRVVVADPVVPSAGEQILASELGGPTETRPSGVPDGANIVDYPLPTEPGSGSPLAGLYINNPTAPMWVGKKLPTELASDTFSADVDDLIVSVSR